MNLSDIDLAAILALNNEHESELSRLDMPGLEALLATAYYVSVQPEGAAFLLAFSHDSHHDGFNFRWFQGRLDRFVYVDRVVVAAAARGRGVARALYGGLFEKCRSDGFAIVCCEVNIDPPNPASDAFHASLGFKAMGQGKTPTGKLVAYYTRSI